jgi:hypothetical protein
MIEFDADDNSKIEIADVPQPLSQMTKIVHRIDIEAHEDNSGSIFIGGSFVRSITGDTKGRQLRPGYRVSYENSKGIDLATVYIAGETVGDYVFWGGERHV